MCDTKKQRWGMETLRPPDAWFMPEELESPKKRNTDLRPYTGLIQDQLDDVHEREDDPDNYDPDVEPAEDPHLYAARARENLIYVAGMKDYEMIELLKQGVDIGKVTIPWLRQFQEDLDLKV